MRASSPTRSDSITFPSRRDWAIIFAAWTLFGVAQLSVDFIVFRSSDMGYMRSMWQVSVQYLPRLWLWAAMTPIVEGWDHRLRDRFKSLPVRISLHVPLYIAASAAEAILRRTTIVLVGMPLTVPFHVTLLYFADIEAVRYIAALMLGRALTAASELTEKVRREVALKEEIASAQLHYLDLQLQPHFLFNALGSISELAHEAPAAAARMVEHLATLLKYATERSIGQEVTLRHELDALSPYLEIQRMRFPDWLSISESIEPDASEALVPRLLLQPLVENAIRHGLSHRRSGGLIEFRARSQNEQLVLSVHDNGAGLTAGSSIPGLGIGLTNIRERLTTLYGESHSLDLVSHAAGGVEVVVKIPLRRPATAHQRDLMVGEDDPAIDVDDTASVPDVKETPIQKEAIRLVGVWLGAGVILTLMSFLYLFIRHPLDHEPWLEVIRRHVIHSSLWILLTPLVLIVARKFPLSRERLAINVPVHIVFGSLIGFIHIAGARILVGGVQPPLMDTIFLDSLFWNMAAYAVLLGFFERRQIERWIQERDVAAAKMRGELTLARLSAVMLELRPDFLLAALTTLRTLVMVDARLAESLLSRFAEFLRLTLDSLGDQNSTLEREAIVLLSYAELHRAAAGHFPEIEMDWTPGMERCLVPNGLLRTLVDRLLEIGGLPGRVIVSARKSDKLLTLRFVPVDIDRGSSAVFSIRRDPSERLGRLTDSGARISYAETTSTLEVVLPVNGDSSHAKTGTPAFSYT